MNIVVVWRAGICTYIWKGPKLSQIHGKLEPLSDLGTGNHSAPYCKSATKKKRINNLKMEKKRKKKKN